MPFLFRLCQRQRDFLFFIVRGPVRGARRNVERPGIRKLLSNPQRLLATILIANNLVNVTIVVLCNFALGPVFAGMSPVLSFVLQTVILTFLILLFGEILPKLYANNYPVTWAKFALPVCRSHTVCSAHPQSCS